MDRRRGISPETAIKFERKRFEYPLGKSQVEVELVRPQSDSIELQVPRFSIRAENGKEVSVLRDLPAGWRMTLDPRVNQNHGAANFLDKVVAVARMYKGETSRRIPAGEPLPEKYDIVQPTMFGESYQRVIVDKRTREVREEWRHPSFTHLPRTLLTTFHEIAHARDPRYQDLKDNFGRRTENQLFGRKTKEQHLLEERGAWDFARAKINELRAAGFDFGKELDEAAIEEIISSAIASYEVD